MRSSTTQPRRSRRNRPGRRTVAGVLASLAVGLLALTSCTPVSYPSPLAYGYSYWDFNNRDFAVPTGVPAGLDGKTTVYAPLDRVGNVVFVELWCYGVKVNTGNAALANMGRGVAEASFAFVNVSSVCTVREHVPNTWSRANYYIRADKDSAGRITASAILLQHL